MMQLLLLCKIGCYLHSKGGPVTGAKKLVTQVPTFITSGHPVTQSHAIRQYSLCPNSINRDVLILQSNRKKARSTR